ncbi:hypothetical protein [Mesorhizobium sp. M0208]
MDDGLEADGAKNAAFCVGKTNIKLSVMTFDGVLAEIAYGEKNVWTQ